MGIYQSYRMLCLDSEIEFHAKSIARDRGETSEELETIKKSIRLNVDKDDVAILEVRRKTYGLFQDFYKEIKSLEWEGVLEEALIEISSDLLGEINDFLAQKKLRFEPGELPPLFKTEDQKMLMKKCAGVLVKGKDKFAFDPPKFQFIRDLGLKFLNGLAAISRKIAKLWGGTGFSRNTLWSEKLEARDDYTKIVDEFCTKAGISPEERAAMEKEGDELSVETIESYHSPSSSDLGRSSV